jgi:cytochrome c
MQENKTPEIRIVTPSPSTTFKWNSLLPYEINVMDEEDGNSEYDEINPNEVLLALKYLRDSTEIKSYLNIEGNTDYNPLMQMGRSTCFNCHMAKGTLIGPSFERIAAKYNNNPKVVESLTQKIINGSTAVWGDEKMPPHPDLKVDRVQEMVRWILATDSDPDKNYLAGIRGAIKTKEREASSSQKNVLVITARYMDHGSDGLGLNHKHAQTTVVLKSD